MKKLIYVTKKQIESEVAYELERLKMTPEELLKEVNITLDDLKEFPDDNANQIKWFTRMAENLQGKIKN